MRFADKLRELRTAAGLSEAKLAEASGVSFGAVHNYGLGIRQPTFAAVVKLARALGVTCEAFAGCEDVAGEVEGGARPRKAAASEPAAPPAEQVEDTAPPKKPARGKERKARKGPKGRGPRPPVT